MNKVYEKPNRKDYLLKIFLHECVHYEEAVMLGEIEVTRAEQALKDRKENLLIMRLKYQLAKAELEKAREL